jgi:hypothetical protein
MFMFPVWIGGGREGCDAEDLKPRHQLGCDQPGRDKCHAARDPVVEPICGVCGRGRGPNVFYAGCRRCGESAPIWGESAPTWGESAQLKMRGGYSTCTQYKEVPIYSIHFIFISIENLLKSCTGSYIGCGESARTWDGSALLWDGSA